MYIGSSNGLAAIGIKFTATINSAFRCQNHRNDRSVIDVKITKEEAVLQEVIKEAVLQEFPVAPLCCL